MMVGNSFERSLGLTAFLGLPSCFVVDRFFAIPSWLYLPLLFALFHWVSRKETATINERVERIFGPLLAVTLFGLLTLTLTMHPIAESGYWGGGSDSDDALDLATERLLRGEHPYRELTYLGNPVSQFPGSLFMAVPFVMSLGSAVLQNVFWIAVLVFFLRRRSVRPAAPLIMVWTMLCVSPVILHKFVTGNDYITNSIVVLICTMWLLEESEAGDKRRGMIPAILLGLTLSTRPVFLVTAPILFVVMFRRKGLRRAILISLVIVTAFLVVTLPFYLWVPADFSPLHVSRKLGRFSFLLPQTTIWITGASLVIGATLAWFRPATDRYALFNCGFDLIIPALAGCTLDSISQGEFSPNYLGFAFFGSFFGTVCLWPDLLDEQKLPRIHYQATAADRS